LHGLRSEFGQMPGPTPHMLGVGFGRGTRIESSPTYNPFLNLTEMIAGTMRRGYIIGRGGLSLGLTESNFTGTWTMQQLANAVHRPPEHTTTG
jgi:hypothetical protein